MHLTCSRPDLTRALKLARSVADSKSTMPLLANVLLVADDDGLRITATDLNVSLTATVPVKADRPGQACFDARALFDLIDRAPSETVTIGVDPQSWAEIKAGKVRYKLAGLNGRDFPKVPEAPALAEVDGDALARLFDRTLFSVCHDESRFHLCGVYLEGPKTQTRAVTTDGHRLTIADEKVGLDLTAPIIVPKKGATEARRLLSGKVRAGVKGLHLFVAIEGVTLSVKLIDAKFPPYEQVVPKGNKHRLTIDRDRLTEALRRASLMASDTRGVKFDLSDAGLQIRADHPDLGETTEDVEAEYEGDALRIGFNPKYVLELLGALDAERVTMAFGGELDPAIVRVDNQTGVLMPMRI